MEKQKKFKNLDFPNNRKTQKNEQTTKSENTVLNHTGHYIKYKLTAKPWKKQNKTWSE